MELSMFGMHTVNEWIKVRAHGKGHASCVPLIFIRHSVIY